MDTLFQIIKLYICRTKHQICVINKCVLRYVSSFDDIYRMNEQDSLIYKQRSREAEQSY